MGTLAAILAACGGGGYGGGGGGGGSGGMGCGSGGYGGGTCPAPTIALASPGATVNRTVTLSATASAASGASVASVDFLIDGASVGKVTTAPYTVNWDSTTVSDGSHALTASVTDNQGQTTTSAAIDIKVENNPTFSVALAASQIVPAPKSNATGTANLSAKLGTGAVSGKVMLSGVTATAVTINEGFAGNTGNSVITLSANAGTAGEWDVPANAMLSADEVNELLQGKLYLIATSAGNPAGEIRGQITPANVSVIFTDLSGAQEVPAVNTNASGVAAVTVDSSANKLSVHVRTSNAADATAAAVDTAAAGSTGAQLVALVKDNVDPGHWSVELAAITAADVSNFNANKWYVNVETPADPNGAVRGQVVAKAAPPPPPAPTLTQLTKDVFQVCGGCHTGGGASLPSSMDLTPGHIYASIVNVPSVEVPSLDRVKPGDPANSYVVQKLEGTAAVGARMPFGGPYLSQSQINELTAWITAGAPNN